MHIKTRSVYLTNRLYFAVRLFSYRSQMSCSLMFLPHFDVFNRGMFVLHNNREKNISLVALNDDDGSSRIFFLITFRYGFVFFLMKTRKPVSHVTPILFYP